MVENNCGKWPWCACDHWCFHADPCLFASCHASTCNAGNAVYLCLLLNFMCYISVLVPHMKVIKVNAWNWMVLLDAMGTFEKLICTWQCTYFVEDTCIAHLLYMNNRQLHHITQIHAYYVYTAAPMPTTCIIYCFFRVSHGRHLLPACHSSHHSTVANLWSFKV